MTASVLVTSKWRLQQSLLACASTLVFISEEPDFNFILRYSDYMRNLYYFIIYQKNLVYYRAILYIQLCMYFANEPINEKDSEIQ